MIDRVRSEDSAMADASRSLSSARVRTNITRLAARKCAAERAPRKIIKSAIIAFQQNNSLYARSPDPLSRSD